MRRMRARSAMTEIVARLTPSRSATSDWRRPSTSIKPGDRTLPIGQIGEQVREQWRQPGEQRVRPLLAYPHKQALPAGSCRVQQLARRHEGRARPLRRRAPPRLDRPGHDRPAHRLGAVVQRPAKHGRNGSAVGVEQSLELVALGERECRQPLAGG